MKTTAILLLLQLFMAAGLAWSCFCRVTKTNADTRREVRWAMVFEGVASLLVLGAPFLPGLMPEDFDYPLWTTPMPVWLMFLLSILSVQLVTAKYWVAGVPVQFQRDPPSRTGHGLAAAFALAMVAISLFSMPREARAQVTNPPAAVYVFGMGETVRCKFAGGCVGMIAPAFESLVDAAERGISCAPTRRSL